LLDRKIGQAIDGIEKSYGDKLYSIGENNALVVADYIAAMNTEINLSPSYRGDNIEALTRFSRYNDNRSFKDLKRADVVAFLDSLRKTEARDPMHKWVGGLAHTTYTGFIYCDSSSGSIILTSNQRKGLSLQWWRISPIYQEERNQSTSPLICGHSKMICYF
jgi:hypothetical protein